MADTTASENGRYGIVLDKKTGESQYDFIPENGFKITVGKPLAATQISKIEDANKTASFVFARDNLARLALHKHARAGELTAQSFFADVASDIMGYGELTIVEACARLRRMPSPFYPISSEIIKMCEMVKAEIDAVLNPQQLKTQPKKEENTSQNTEGPTEEEKTRVADLVQQALRNLGAG